MTPSTLRRHHPRAVVAHLGAVVAGAVVLIACSGGGAAGNDPVPTLLTTPLPSSTSSTSTVAPTTTADAVTTVAGNGSTSSTSASTTSTSLVAASTTTGAPGASTSAAPTSPPGGASTSTSAATTTTLDIEPPPTTPAPTAPVPTAAQPPDTIGGREEDYLLTANSIVGLQFGASEATVLDRMTDLLGDPLTATPLRGCATAYQWFNLGVVVTDRGLAYYSVAMDYDLYGDAPIPNWHTSVDLAAGDDQVALEAAYPGQITYQPPSGALVEFAITSGADVGLEGALFNGVLQTLSAGVSSC